MIFYRNICDAALDVAPVQALEAIVHVLRTFEMPGAGMPNFRRNGVLMAKHGIYDLRQHLDDVVMPVLRKWRIFERDFGAGGAQLIDELGTYLEELERQAVKFEDMRDRSLAREAAKLERAGALS